MSSVAQFEQSAHAFVDLVHQIPADAWNAPGLGEWTVRSLVGHTTRAILTVEQYLHLDDPGEVNVPDAEHYYAQVYVQFTDPDAVRERGVEAGRWLGEDPALRIVEALGRANLEIELAGPQRVVSIGGMGIPLPEYLRTRVLELVVHTFDIARAIGRPAEVPVAAIEAATALAASTAALRGDGEAVLRALTGRGTLPEGFSVV
jgi:uncharacterized protein (TIGR03083 family)